jgi:hypothetical protein
MRFGLSSDGYRRRSKVYRRTARIEVCSRSKIFQNCNSDEMHIFVQDTCIFVNSVIKKR